MEQLQELLSLLRTLNSTLVPEFAYEIGKTCAIIRDELVKQGFNQDQAVLLMSKMNVK